MRSPVRPPSTFAPWRPDAAAVRPGRGRAALAADVGGGGPLPRGRRRGGEASSSACPPPNVTGELHMGHALNGTLQDVLVRWHRMRASTRCGSPGYDHAGISTQNVVEKQLAAEGLTRHDLGREAFVERTWEWLERVRAARSCGQFRRLGASLDYARERFTMDDDYVRAVLHVLRAAVGRRLDLPRQPHRQLVPVPPDGASPIWRSSTRTWTTR